MTQPVLLVAGLAASIALAIIAKRIQLPYPVVFVAAGTALAFVPNLPPVHIAPDWIFLAVLPPLLFSAGWDTDWTMFRNNLRPILQLAIGLVVLTTVAVTALTIHVLPALGFAAAFVLGAIVSPTDAVAAGETFTRFSIPRRIAAIVEGEGLINDATALVIYGNAVGAAAAITFSASGAVASFIAVSIGGIIIGAIVAWIVETISRKLDHFGLSDSLIDNLLLIGAPYAAYLCGQAAHVSGVLAVVVAGITLSRRSSVVYGPQTRLIAWNVWSLWIFLLNAYIFLALGLQLRTFVRGGAAFFSMLPAALEISAVVIAVRLLWVFPVAWLSRLFPGVRRADPMPQASYLALIGWTGMRGIVSLAAALALPNNFPHRESIVFITFVVIFVTLVGQGITLEPVLKLLHIGTESEDYRREVQIRLEALRAGVRRIDELARRNEDSHTAKDIDRLRGEYENRMEHLQYQLRSKKRLENFGAHTYVEQEALRAERNAVMQMRDRGEIPDESFRSIQYDLDLAESRLS